MLYFHQTRPYLFLIEGLDDKLEQLRKPNFFVKSTGARRPTLTGNSWAKMPYGDTTNKSIPGRSLALQIKCQFGPCNVKLRNKYMILDTVNWDNMPKAFDSKVDKIITDSNDVTYL